MHAQPDQPEDYCLTRRDFLRRTGMGFGAFGLAGVLAAEAGAAGNPMLPKGPHFAPRARRVVHIFLNGGASQVDTWDPKPALTKHAGQAVPHNLKTERPTGAAMPSPFTFARYGESGIEASELFAKTAAHADDLCVIRSMYADVPNHEPSLLLMNCGESRLVRPSVGSWVTYGLGTENQNLPGFVTMCPGGYPIQESQNWQCGFLPGIFQGTYLDPQHRELDRLIANIESHYTSLPAQRAQLDLLRELNGRHRAARADDAAIEARIASFELAYRMQIEATDAFDIAREPESIRAMYGDGTHGRMFLIARRLLERGVRFVQLWHGDGQPWDHHDNIAEGHKRLGDEIDGPIAALLSDLKQRGMLDETLVVCSGEFGRTPTVELPTPGLNAGSLSGRDHNHYGFSLWMAGGGARGGHVHGATDEFGFEAVQDKVHVHDLHATMLHLLGFDHERLTYRYAGRDFRLTDVHGRVVRDLIA